MSAVLALKRKVGESIRIGSSITVTVSRLEGRRVTLLIQAPRQVQILRTELEGRPPKPPDPPRG